MPKTTLKLIEFDFETPDRIRWTAQPNCVLVRVKSDSTREPAAVAPTAPATATPKNASAPTSSPTNARATGVLSLSVGTPSVGNNVAGRKLLVLKEDAQVALIKGGITNTAHTPPLPPGRYWVLSDAKVANKQIGRAHV